LEKGEQQILNVTMKLLVRVQTLVSNKSESFVFFPEKILDVKNNAIFNWASISLI